MAAFIAAHGGGNGGVQLGDVVVPIAGGSVCCCLPLAFFAAVRGVFLPPCPCPGYWAGNDGRHFPFIMRAAVVRVQARAEKRLHFGWPPGPPARRDLCAGAGSGAATSPHQPALLHREAFALGWDLLSQPFYARALRLGCSYPRSALVVQP